MSFQLTEKLKKAIHELAVELAHDSEQLEKEERLTHSVNLSDKKVVNVNITVEPIKYIPEKSGEENLDYTELKEEFNEEFPEEDMDSENEIDLSDISSDNNEIESAPSGRNLFTEDEKEEQRKRILSLVKKGFTQKQIAEKLGISKSTVARRIKGSR